ncbi:Crp/Fnr family transcriptional regulator [Streptomyces gobiensis]|uniref:Crp/Fnr family transcriptional regulator n=1 Tax=Streptomyces gobiensis TaxID=2875706 RepID=UPI001E571BC0|nr:Crp/Fnr family transcriptional regulator [Streptomyces gobiensis]UGY92924.1 Crp/Fnr family transcriptional regulator [Streptomyces gobiensis]
MKTIETEQSRAALRAAAWVMRCLGDRWPPDEEEAAELAARLEERLLAPGEVAFSDGRLPDGVWIVRSGTLELVSGAGRRRVVIGVVQPSGIAGDVPLLLRRPAVYTVRALTDVQAGYLPARSFLTLLESSPVLARAWLTGLAHRHAKAQEALAQSVGGNAECRVARLLLREARGGSVSCSQDTLARMLGLRRPTLNRVLKEFERDGLLRLGYRRVELLARDGLRDRARGGD